MTPPKHHREAVIRHIGEDGSIYVGVPSANDDPVIRLSPEFLDAVVEVVSQRWVGQFVASTTRHAEMATESES